MSDSKPKKFTLNFETVGSIAAMIIGACALFVAWDQAQIMRKQQHAAVVPIVFASAKFDRNQNTQRIYFLVRNTGIGPALIKTATIRPNGKSLEDFIEAIPDEIMANTKGISRDDISTQVLGPGEQTIPFSITINMNTDIIENADQLWNSFSQVDWEICYCSVFEKCWMAETSNSYRQKQVKYCTLSK